MKNMRLSSRALAVSVAAGLLAPLGLMSAAHASDQDGRSDSREFVFYYNSNNFGSPSDFENSKSNLAGYVFLGPGTGQGTAVKNHAASVSNNHPTKTVNVYFNSGYQGVFDSTAPYTNRNLSKTYNENASFQFQS